MFEAIPTTPSGYAISVRFPPQSGHSFLARIRNGAKVALRAAPTMIVNDASPPSLRTE